MKILSRMLSKKAETSEGLGPVEEGEDFDPEARPVSRPASRPVADDTGMVNPTQARRPAPNQKIVAKPEEPDVAASGWEDSDWDEDDWDDDEDWGEEEMDIDLRRKTSDKHRLVTEIRDAMRSVGQVSPDEPERAQSQRPTSRDWSDDEDFGRRAQARNAMSNPETEERIMEKTESAMTDIEVSRRRSSMAHLKAAAAATKADRVLRHVVSRDPSADPEEQSPYRDDLAKVVRPHSTSRPISRVVTRPNTRSPIWDQGAGDDDAALFAAAEDGMTEDPAMSVENEMSAAEAARMARTPPNLSEDDFADEVPASSAETKSAFPSSPFARQVSEPQPEQQNAFGDIDEDDFEDDFDDEDDYDDFDDEDEFSPRPSRVVSEAVAFANAEDEEEDQSPSESDVRKKIWEMADEVATEVEQAPAAAPENFAAAAVSGRSGRSAGRVKTRLLGFQADEMAQKDVFQEEGKDKHAGVSLLPVGWIVLIDGPGRGYCFTLHSGVSQIGRGEDQAVRLDFGDTSISRNNHAAVAYDDEQGKFFLGHGGKSNMVRLNGMPVLSTEEMSNGDEIRIGETTLKFVALCGEAFTWASEGTPAAE